MKIKNKFYFVLPFLFLAIAFFIKQFIVINITNSMQRGIYLKSHQRIAIGDIILFCLDEKSKRLGLEKHYLETGKVCNGSAPLIKQVIAIPGDNVLLSDNGITVNDFFYNYPTLHQDSRQQKLSVYPQGKYDKTNGYWVIGTNAKNSWDSRYWGSIQRSQILAKLTILFSWIR